jgi:hypothetical protein
VISFLFWVIGSSEVLSGVSFGFSFFLKKGEVKKGEKYKKGRSKEKK